MTVDARGAARFLVAQLRRPTTTTLVAYALAQFVVLVGAFVRIPLITDAVGAVGYGRFVVITSLFPFIQLIAGGMESAGRIAVARDFERSRGVLAVLSRLGWACFAGVCLLAVGVATIGPVWFEVETARTAGLGLALVASMLPISAFRGALEGYGHTAVSHLANMANTVVGVPLLILGFLVIESPVVAVLSTAIGVLAPVGVGALWLRFRTDYRNAPPCQATPAESRMLKRLTASMTGWSVSNMMIYGFDPMIVAAVSGEVAAGTYAVAGRLLLMVLVLSDALGPQFAVRFTRLRSQGDRSAVQAELRRLTLFMGAAAAVLVVVYIAIGPWAMRVLTHGELEAAPGLFVVLGVNGWITVVTLPFAAACAAPAMAGYRARMGLAWSAANLATSIALAGVFGILGPILGSIICTSGMYLTLFFKARRQPELIEVGEKDGA